MRRWLILAALLLAVVGVACAGQAWQVRAALDADEQVVFTLCAPSVRHCDVQCDAVMAEGSSGRPPRVGQWCRQQADGLLFCGRGYWRLRFVSPVTPA